MANITQQKERQPEKASNIPETVLPRVVIIGAGFGGLQAATHLRRAPIQLTVIDRTNHHLFQALLYQVATATLSPGEISSPIRHVLKRQRNTQVIMDEVTGINVEEKQVRTQGRSIPYDYLIIATGARENYFGHDEWRQFAPTLKSIEDARLIRHKLLLAFEAAELEQDPERVKELLTFVIIGAGPTGVETAGAIAEVAHKVLKTEFRKIDPSMARIVLVEAAPRVLGTFPEKLSQKAQKELEKLGVEVRTGAAVSAIDKQSVIAGGERIQAQTILWTAGVLASPAAKWLGVEADRAGRVLVETDLSVSGHPNIFVIGDTAACTQNGRPLPGLAPVAMQQGHYVARLLKQRLTGKEVTHPIGPFSYVNKGNLATIGRAFAIFHLGRIQLAGFLAWLLWLAVHIFYLIGFENRILVMMQWGWSYLMFHRGVRLITIPHKWNLLTPPPEPQKQSEDGSVNKERANAIIGEQSYVKEITPSDTSK